MALNWASILHLPAVYFERASGLFGIQFSWWRTSGCLNCHVSTICYLAYDLDRAGLGWILIIFRFCLLCSKFQRVFWYVWCWMASILIWRRKGFQKAIRVLCHCVYSLYDSHLSNLSMVKIAARESLWFCLCRGEILSRILSKSLELSWKGW